MIKALVVDDNPEFVSFMRELLCERMPGAVVDVAADAPAALELFATGAHDVVVLDIAIKGRTNGLALLARMRELGPRPPIIMLTNYALPEYELEATRLGADRFLPKSGSTSEQILASIVEVTSQRL